jgi:hypothetical protein
LTLLTGKSQKQRLAALASFKSEHVPLLLATDVAARGLDIPSVDLVVNYDLPVLAADYVHRFVSKHLPGWYLLEAHARMSAGDIVSPAGGCRRVCV